MADSGSQAGDRKEGTIGYYWTGSIVGNDSQLFKISSNEAVGQNSQRAVGAAVRCIKE